MYPKKIHFFALAAFGVGLSGGDRIFIELARRWQRKSEVTIFVNEEGRELCRRQNLSSSDTLKYVVWPTGFWKQFGFLSTYFGRIIISVINSSRLSIVNNNSTVIYSASEFWMDSLACFILKIRFSDVRWVASWYQTAPNPLKGFTEGNRKESYKFSAFLYWIVQLPIRPLVSFFADIVLVNNELERKVFPNKDEAGKVKVLLGAVDIKSIKRWQEKNGKLTKIYDAVFQGRFHPQKGVVELIEIWKLVTQKLPKAKLAMIGDGQLMQNVKSMIRELNLENNIRLFGYVFDGTEKYRIFSASKLVVHPSFYDSGGMASAEAMAFGTPCIGFDLKSYDSYYPKGMIKVEKGNLSKFAKEIVDLLGDNTKRKTLGEKALRTVGKGWSWDKRAEEVFDFIC